MAKKKTTTTATPPASTITVNVESPLYRSFRVDQLAGMFDVPLEERCGESFTVELPTLEEPWQIGLVVGPSGSGKSTIARHAWPSELIQGFQWHADRAVIDEFGDHSPYHKKKASASVGTKVIIELGHHSLSAVRHANF